MFDIHVINLERRQDRRQNIISQFKDLNFCKVRFWKAKEYPFNPPVGCFLSHQAIVKWAKERRLPYVIVAEDDIRLKITKEELRNVLEILTRNADKFELFNGSPSFWNKRFLLNTVKKTKSELEDFSFVTDAQCSIFSVYTSKVYDKFLAQDPLQQPHVDVFRAENIPQLVYKKYVCDQIPGWSDLGNKTMDLGDYFIQQEQIYQKLNFS